MIGIPASSLACPPIDSEYFPLFNFAVKRYWKDDYRKRWDLLAAQCFTESNFRGDAISPAGAIGICQFLPNTFTETRRRFGFRGSIRNIKTNIYAGAAYNERIRSSLTAARKWQDETEIVWGCYNAGCGNIFKAQKLSGNPDANWPLIAKHLPRVTGKHSTETINYVKRNWFHRACIRRQ